MTSGPDKAVEVREAARSCGALEATVRSLYFSWRVIVVLHYNNFIVIWINSELHSQH